MGVVNVWRCVGVGVGAASYQCVLHCMHKVSEMQVIGAWELES